MDLATTTTVLIQMVWERKRRDTGRHDTYVFNRKKKRRQSDWYMMTHMQRRGVKRDDEEAGWS